MVKVMGFLLALMKMKSKAMRVNTKSPVSVHLMIVKFFIGTSTCILYLCDMLLTHDLMELSLQFLISSVSFANGSTGVPAVISSKCKFGDCDESV